MLRRAALLSMLLFTAAAAAEPAPKKDAKAKPNRLAQESSPYLLQHAHNPVDWYPWGVEAFAKAKKEGKLVFLSIGYSSCHWCHVMERESFANPEVAKVMNEHFVCIKVDREERPDIDQIYMAALQVFGQGGGWPLSMFLTADGKPILGGTYWPAEDKEVDGQKIRGVKSIMKAVQRFWKENPKQVTDQADKVAEAASNALTRMTRGIALVERDRALVAAAIDAVKEEYDPIHGGFGSPQRKFRGTKFPTPPLLDLLAHEAARLKSDELTAMLTKTLDRMAEGGIHDQVGGGFHRYSTERTWTVPHFEKMLYDNAQLVEVYAGAYQRSKKPLYRQVVRTTLDFVARELTSPEGAFYSALDADSSGMEGRFYVWTDAEIDAVLTDPAERALAKKVYGADGQPNFEAKYRIFVRRKSLAEVADALKIKADKLPIRLEAARQKLFAARAKRERPFLDTKVLTAWNGQMIAAYAVAGWVLQEPKYVQTAARAADFLLKTMRTKDGRLLRAYGAKPGGKPAARLNGYLDDYAYLVHGLLALHDATADKKWLDEAKALNETMMKLNGDDKQGGFFYTASDGEKLFARAKDQHDGAQPSANSVAARNLVRLWAKTGDDRYRAQAEKSFKTFALAMKSNPTSLTTMAQALAMYLDRQEKKK